MHINQTEQFMRIECRLVDFHEYKTNQNGGKPIKSLIAAMRPKGDKSDLSPRKIHNFFFKFRIVVTKIKYTTKSLL